MYRGRGVQLSVRHRKCQYCGASVVVPKMTPCPCPERITGIYILAYDDEGEERHVGYACLSCMDKKSEEGVLSLGFCGGKLNDLSRWEGVLIPKDRRVKEIVSRGLKQ